MRSFNLMQKTNHYKSSLPDFAVDEVVVARHYDQDMQKKIRRFKFVHNYVDRVYFDSLFQELIKEIPVEGDIITYPPIRWIDRILRWPNHARILAEYFQKHVPMKILCPFHKSLFATHQSRRKKSERTRVRKEYSLITKYIPDIRGKSVILVDDLITTGHTAHALATLLKKAGAKSVTGYFLASEKV
jgi:predicted amidophosphoribosyltransferase